MLDRNQSISVIATLPASYDDSKVLCLRQSVYGLEILLLSFSSMKEILLCDGSFSSTAGMTRLNNEMTLCQLVL